jgi:hypothetical protein
MKRAVSRVVQSSASRTAFYLSRDPSSKLLGYFHSSAARTFCTKVSQGDSNHFSSFAASRICSGRARTQ